MSTDESGVKTSAVAEPEGTEPSQELPTLPPTTSSALPPTPPQSSSEVTADEPAACLSAEEVQKDTANKLFDRPMKKRRESPYGRGGYYRPDTGRMPHGYHFSPEYMVEQNPAMMMMGAQHSIPMMPGMTPQHFQQMGGPHMQAITQEQQIYMMAAMQQRALQQQQQQQQLQQAQQQQMMQQQMVQQMKVKQSQALAQLMAQQPQQMMAHQVQMGQQVHPMMLQQQQQQQQAQLQGYIAGQALPGGQQMQYMMAPMGLEQQPHIMAAMQQQAVEQQQQQQIEQQNKTNQDLARTFAMVQKASIEGRDTVTLTPEQITQYMQYCMAQQQAASAVPGGQSMVPPPPP